MSVRLNAIAGLLAICQRLVKRYGANEKNICPVGRNGRHCDVIVFGSLIKGLQALDMWPLPSDAASIHTSIDQFSRTLKAITCYNYSSDHQFCGFASEMESSVNGVVQGMPSAVLPHHVKHMEEQRKKLG